MHPYALFPLLALVAAGLLASAVAAREPDRRASRLLSWLLGGAGIWSLFELLSATAPDAQRATILLRLGSTGSMMLGPLTLHLVAVGIGVDRGRLRDWISAGYLAGIVSVGAAVATPAVVAGAVRTPWGWSPVPGAALGWIYGFESGIPLLGILLALWKRPPDSTLSAPQLARIAVASCLCLLVASLTDCLLPLHGVFAPRLGSASVVAWAAYTWWTAYRSRELRLSPQRFAREILDALPDGVALLRLDGRIRTSNSRLGELADRPDSELSGVAIGELLSEAPGDASGAEYECELLRNGGLRIPVSVSHLPLVDPDGDPIGRVVVVRDLRELTALRTRLVASGRLVAVGQLAAGIAHEINNPIAYVRSNLGMLSQDWERAAEALSKQPLGPAGSVALEEGPELLSEAGEGIDRVAAIVRDVGGFSRAGGVETEAADLAQLLDRAVRVAAPQLGRIEIERDYGELPLVPCVPQEIMQVFLNLLMNAAHALRGRGRIRLSTRLEDVGAVVEVADEGVGMDPELISRIFEPFFTTKPVGEGTGLGLPISQQIVARHGGEIHVESAPGRGATFRVLLPVGRRAAAAGEPG